MRQNKIELLAPARDLSCAKAAVTYGADAVYMGSLHFGARKGASNSLQDIIEAVEFAHKFNAKIYITVNTLLRDFELSECEKLIWDIYRAGADAIIIQDMGLLELNLPEIELHASTQCSIITPERAKFFQDIGFKRIILERQLSLDEIKKISDAVDIEIECFCHGALCVSYSGLCYMSASVGERSANRGDCAQPCRKQYSLVNEKGDIIAKNKYLLSMKDFCAEKYIDDLVEAGVKSFKIEGRLKDENYIKNVVLYYRKLLDKYQKTSDGAILSDFEPDINKTFNRGYTSYFLNSDAQIYNFDTPKSTGEYLGKVSKVCKNSFFIETDKEISNGDGLCFISKGKLTGFYANLVKNNEIFPNAKIKLQKNDEIYRNLDVKFINSLKNSKTKRLIGAKITLLQDKIEAKYKDIKTEIEYSYSEFAKDENKMKEAFINCFKKSGNSIFTAAEFEFKTDAMPFLKISYLNELRRNLYTALEKCKIEMYKKEKPQKINYAQFNESGAELNIYNKCALEFYKHCGVKNPQYSKEYAGNFKEAELMRTRHCLRRAFNLCLKKTKDTKRLFLIDEKGKKYLLKFDCKNCEMVIT